VLPTAKQGDPRRLLTAPRGPARTRSTRLPIAYLDRALDHRAEARGRVPPHTCCPRTRETWQPEGMDEARLPAKVLGPSLVDTNQRVSLARTARTEAHRG
jgi:hypothetical protein